ncbi:RidA family protein [Streptomyces jumonjinensis]|uniref:RidA family protein n=1 Tax=Streptomyces jumonjinensis TaxID=1945 RepID=UPI0037A134B7
MYPEPLQTPGLTTLGPYSPAVTVGPFVFVSAQSGVVPATGEVPPGPFEAECRQAFANLESVLKAAGSTLDRVAKLTVFYTDLADLPTLNEICAHCFPERPPARSAAVVTLPGGRRISVDAIAVGPA